MTQGSSFSYAVFSFVTDQIRGTSLPVGVGLWGSSFAGLRFAQPGESVPGLKRAALPYLRTAETQIRGWVAAPQLPYATSPLEAGTEAWWRHLSSLLFHGLVLSEPRAIDCHNPAEEIELLFEAVVGPQRPEGKTGRVDGVLNNVLGSLGERLDRGLVDGFGGRPVPVRRFKQGSRGLLLVDAVNLAAASAEGQTDALVSRIQRVRARQDQPGRPVMAMVGYLASPAGLNGERALLEWIQQKAEASTFDLLREGAQFGDRVHAALAEVGQPSAQPRLGE